MTMKVDLHIHTDASQCSTASPASIVEAALSVGLDGIAITDHDTMVNVEAVEDLAPPALEVIAGVEVSTPAGHLLALGVEACPSEETVEAIITDIHDQGGLVIGAHPFDRFRRNGRETMTKYLAQCDAVEGVNSRCLLARDNYRARITAKQHGLPITGGSDAHFPFEIGRAYTVTEGPVLEAIREGTSTAVGHGRYLTGHAATKLLAWSW